MHCCERSVAGAGALVCGTGYTGEDGVELLLDPADAPGVWDALHGAGVTPTGLGARDTLRLEVCFHLYGNDLSEDRGPIEAGLGWCCKEQTGFIGSQATAAVRAAGPKEKLVPFLVEGRGIARQGNPVVGGGQVTSGTFSPCLEQGIGMAYVPAERAEPGARIEIDVRGTTRQADRRAQASLPKGIVNMAEASYPEDLLYHAEHDWARVEGETATFGVTWYAQDSLGELVFFDPPEVGAKLSKDDPYSEVESVKAVSDVIAPMSGEVIEINGVLADKPEKINEDPYGDGWLVKVKLSDPSEAESLMDAAAYEATLAS